MSASILVHTFGIIVVIVELSLQLIHVVALESMLIALRDYGACLAGLG